MAGGGASNPGGTGGAAGSGGSSWQQTLSDFCIRSCNRRRSVPCASAVPETCETDCSQEVQIQLQLCPDELPAYLECSNENPSVQTYICENGQHARDPSFVMPCVAQTDALAACLSG
jgi:hypothetical protein